MVLMLWMMLQPLMPPVQPSLPAWTPPEAERMMVLADDPWLGRDKGQHLVASAIMTGMLNYMARRQWGARQHAKPWMGAAAVLSLGGLKEIWDARRPGHSSSWKDMAADAAGVLIGGLLLTW